MPDSAQQILDAEIKTLTKKRSTLKKRVTCFGTYLDNIQNLVDELRPQKVERVTHLDLETRLDQFSQLYQEFDKVQTKLEEIHDNEDAQIQYREEFETSYYKTLSLAKLLLGDCAPDLGATPSAKAAVSDDANVNIKLPQIRLPTFNGNYLNWLEFRDTFESLINNDIKIGAVQKFHYLRSSLQSNAAELINSIEFSAANYELAWDLLCERYNNKQLLVHNHLQSLFEHTPIQKESSNSLRELLDSITKNLRSLSSLNINTDGWDILIIHLMSAKLDKTTGKLWKECKLLNELPTLNEFKDFVKGRADLLETLEYTQPVKLVKHCEFQQQSCKIQRPVKSFVVATKATGCSLCSGDHHLRNCDRFLNSSVNERINTVKDLRLCINCLNGKHLSRNCSSSLCRKCNGKHHTLLHYGQKSHCEDDSNKKGQDLTVSCSAKIANQKAILSTAVIRVFDSTGNVHTCRVLLDSGSQSNFISSELCTKLQIETINTNLSVVGINEVSSPLSRRCLIKIQSLHCAFETRISCFVIPIINTLLPNVPIDRSYLDIPGHIKLADPLFDKPDRVDMLLGAGIFWDLLCVGQVRLGKNLPILQKTKFGWVVSGQYNQFPQFNTTHCNMNTENDALAEQLSKFWQYEDVSPLPILSPEEQECENIFVNTHRRDDSGRFIVTIPLKQSTSHLGDSRQTALNQLHNLERRFEKNPNLRKEYIKFMDEYEQLGHMTKSPDLHTTPSYYLPHHGVFNKGKIRVVFNGSSPTDSGVSFNQLQYIGPTIQNELISIILRFRIHRFVLGADIVKMYRQILIHPEQRCFQKILWRKNTTQPISTYQLNTVTYGMTAAPFLAIRCLFQLAHEFSSKYSTASNIIKHDFYVDDMLTGAETINEAIRLGREISSILESAGMNLSKWTSNSKTILRGINSSTNPVESLHFSNNSETKMLGLYWSCNSDALMYQIVPTKLKTYTKRAILSGISRIFDPLGLLSPCVVIAKIMLQELWCLRLSWDEGVPISLHTKWDRFQTECSNLRHFQIPRRVVSDTWNHFDLHGFADASQQAYGACIYVRTSNESGDSETRLLCAKTRVAPIKSMSIPRLELCAAVLLIRLMGKVCSSLHVIVNSTHYWSDSTIVLNWIRLPSRQLQTFVGNRVSQIQSFSKFNQWHHVHTHENPADLLSRGVFPDDLIANKLWWRGPQWLSKPMSEWPNYIPPIDPQVIELKNSTQTFTAHVAVSLFPFTRFSEFNRLNRSCAYVLRFIFNCKNPREKKSGPLNASELKNSTLKLVYAAQREYYHHIFTNLELPSRDKTFKGELDRLSPFFDDTGLLRVGGRMHHTKFSFEKKHPAILPPKHHLSLLLLKHEHIRLLHAGPQLLLASIRERFWPIRGRNLARLIVFQCLTCFKTKPHGITPIMGNLPAPRVTALHPFHTVGVDYAGPIFIKNKKGRGNKIIPAYICLFICFSTKAVHLELVSDLTTECFLATFRRFVSRRGKPSQVFSDNGKTFIGAKSELAKLGNFILSQQQTISQSLGNDNVNWQFIPAYAPHMGGLWEAGVKSCKHHLRRVMANATLTFEECYTVLCQIESTLNSRPLTPLSPDPSDLEALTPAHFLIGRTLTSLPDPDVTHIAEARLNTYQRLQQIQQHFWNRWSKEYVSELQTRTKWKSTRSSLTPGTMVLIRQDNVPPRRWALGRIIQVHAGADGVARVATMKTASGEIKRAFTKICPLPIQ